MHLMGKAGEEKSWPMSRNYFCSPEKLKEHVQLQPIRIGVEPSIYRLILQVKNVNAEVIIFSM
jgi:hypothetical protein